MGSRGAGVGGRPSTEGLWAGAAHGPTGCSQWPTGHSGLLRLQQRRGQGSGQVVTADRDPRHHQNNHQHRERRLRSRTGPGARAEGLCGEMLVQERLSIGFFNPTADKTHQRACQSRPPGPWQTCQTTCCARRPRNLFLKSCPEELDVAWLLSPDME